MDFLIDLSKDSADACADNAVPTRRMTCTSPRLITMELSCRECGPWRSDQDRAKQGDSGRMVALAAYEQLASTMSGLRHMRSWTTPVRYPLFLLREVYVRLNVLHVTLGRCRNIVLHLLVVSTCEEHADWPRVTLNVCGKQRQIVPRTLAYACTLASTGRP